MISHSMVSMGCPWTCPLAVLHLVALLLLDLKDSMTREFSDDPAFIIVVLAIFMPSEWHSVLSFSFSCMTQTSIEIGASKFS